MALHLILLAANKVNPGLQGSIILHSDCAGALARVSELLDGKIPSVCKHADILKTILIASKQISFRRLFQHVAAHQDDHMAFSSLSRASQLNCAVDAGAKRALVTAVEEDGGSQRPFPLEPLICFAGRKKLTSKSKSGIRLWRTTVSEDLPLGPAGPLPCSV